MSIPLHCFTLVFLLVLIPTTNIVSASASLPPPFAALSTKNPADLGYSVVHRDGESSPQSSLYCFEDKRKPLPTNHWWVPAVRPMGPSLANYITPLPYIYNVLGSSLEVSYPWVLAQPNVVQNIVNRHWTIACGGASSFCINKADEMTASFKWGSKMDTTITRGGPYATVNFHSTNPTISTQQGTRAVYVNGVSNVCDGNVVTGNKFSVVLRDSDEEWVVYTAKGTSFNCQATPSSFSLSSNGSFSGIIRLALANNCTTGMDGVSPHCPQPKGNNHTDGAPYREALDLGANVCVFGAAIQLKKLNKALHTTITWQTEQCWKDSPEGILLTIALPHHMPLFDCKSVRLVPVGGHRNLRGYCSPVQSYGNTWVYVAPEQHIDWVGTPDKDKIPDLVQALKGLGNSSDMNYDLEYDAAHGIIDPYNGGKLLAKIGRIVLIANALGEIEIQNTLLERLTRHLNTWLNHHTANLMLYDSSWGGIISCGCMYHWLEEVKHGECTPYENKLQTCPTLSDPGFDFGNGFYNDHHFHYGYFIYAAAVVAKFNASWVTEYNEKVLVLVRDIASPGPSDPYFAPFRYFDWYVGHSWASGLVANPLGRNQESTSEAVNAWYGMYLYGQATNNALLTTIGEAMLILETHSTNVYWHVPIHLQIYPGTFDHSMVGIMHELLIEFQTYFGVSGYFVHGIQVLPITPVVHLMFHPGWVSVGFPKFKKFCEADPFCTESGFVSFMIAEWALVNKEEAWKAAKQLPDKVFDISCAGGNGNSRVGLLYFITAWGNHPEPNWTDMRQRVCMAETIITTKTVAPKSTTDDHANNQKKQQTGNATTTHSLPAIVSIIAALLGAGLVVSYIGVTAVRRRRGDLGVPEEEEEEERERGERSGLLND